MYNPNHTLTKSTMKIYSIAGSTSEQTKSTLKNTSKSRKQPKTPVSGKVNPIGPQRYPKSQNQLEMGQIKSSKCGLSLQINYLNCGKLPFNMKNTSSQPLQQPNKPKSTTQTQNKTKKPNAFSTFAHKTPTTTTKTKNNKNKC